MPDGPDEQLLWQLRGLRDAMGGPTLEALRHRGGPGVSTTSEMLSGKRPPSRQTAERFVEACLRYGRERGIAAAEDHDLLILMGLRDDRRPAPLLERDEELRWCTEHLRRTAVRNQGGLIVVEGPAGIGKTALLRLVRSIGNSLGLVTLAGRGTPLSREMFYSGVRDLLARWMSGPIRDGDLQLPPAASHMLGIAGNAAQGGPADATDGFEALVRALELRTAVTGAVLVVDDVQWLDRSSLRWLVYLSSRLDQLPISIVVGRRLHEESGDETLLNQLAAAAARRILPMPLSQAAVAELIRRRYDAHVNEAFAVACHSRSGGNPFMLDQLLHEADRRSIGQDEASVKIIEKIIPSRVTELVDERVGRYGQAALALVRAVAVLGAPARIDEIARFAGLDITAATTELDRLCAGELLNHEPVIDFVHPLIRDAVERAMTPSQRSAAHARAARALHTAGAPAELVGAHLVPVFARGDPWVVTMSREAAREASAAGAADEATRYLRRALHEPPTPDLIARIRLELGHALTHVSLPQAHQELLLAYQDADDDELRAAAALALAKAYAHADRMGDSVRHLTRAINDVTSEPFRQRLMAERLIWATFWADDPERVRRSVELSEVAAHATVDDHAGQTAIALYAWDRVLRGEPRRQGLALIHPIVDSGLNFTDATLGFDIPTVVAFVEMFSEELALARRLFDGAVQQLRAAGWSGTHLAFTQAHVAHVALREGRLADAEADARIALRIADRLGEVVPATWYATGSLIEALVARGAVKDAQRVADRRHYSREQPAAFIVPNPKVSYGELLAATGRAEQAIAVLRHGGDWLQRRGVHNPAFAPWRLKLAELLSSSAPAEATRHAQTALEQAERFGAPTPRIRSRLALAALTQRADAEALLREAVDIAESSPNRLIHAQALLALSLVRHRGPDRRLGRETLRAGRRLAAQCRAGTLVGRFGRILGDAGPADGRHPVWTRLTAEEQRVGELIVAGHTESEAANTMALAREQVTRMLSTVLRICETNDLVEVGQLLSADGP
ncbi:AAA family ATPase [Dactylosporangium sp. CS-047395]|uniref:AAA family ATPase n=1 Tax=Dactylosporangium sp. CS-047395 TaxID=3239936 RepID=UPI003D907B6D